MIISEFAPDMMPAISGVTGPDYLRLLTGHGYTLSVIHPNAPIQPAGQDIAAVMAAYTSRGTDHIDIIATPPSHTGTH